MAYTIKFRPAVEKNLRTFPQKELIRIKRKIDALSENLPDPAITKMKGNNKFHKIRAGDYRIIYEIHNDTLVILVVKIGHSRLIHDTVEKRENTIVTRRGKPVAVIVPYDEYERNVRMEGYQNIMEAREAFLKAGVIADDVYRESRAQLEEKP